jgi:hypothetical protein
MFEPGHRAMPRNERYETRKVVAITRNMGTVDGGLRVFVVALIAIVVAFVIGAGTAGGVLLLAVAGIILASSATAFCPTYTRIGISTYPSGAASRRASPARRSRLVR